MFNVGLQSYASVTKQRSALTQELQLASKQYGADPQFNPRLASVITAAKKQGFPKASIENAIARGQGRSPTGAALDSLTIEAMVPPSVAIIVECQTDSKARTLGDMKSAIKDYGGTMTPTSHMFDRKGKIVFEGSKNIGEEEMFDQAIEAGAIDVQMEDDGTVVVYAESSQTTAVANAMAKSSGLKVESLDIIWDPKEDTMVNVASPEALDSFLGRIEDDPSVQDVYTNAS
ncbi:MAG: Translational activator of mitochondrially encoded cytochrome c oxidase I [Alectoria fallacina]|uniref:Translational activator of mitochondrially encoded cytochrome c oxidase I n=1 Tax=Alectoria fallacina TaxID=1903189 RepID=A0A8H3EHB2_9LECA|nr:MAG: Translational activator of mitochondrially encoded cytochrome c oxidase I [Alectoria fallacina]